MGNSNISEGMLDVFIYESEMLLETMEQLAMDNEDGEFDEAGINEIFRSMHTIKGSSAIMMYQNITTVSHKLEDIFYYIRESHPENIPQKELVDRMLDVSDFIKGELAKIRTGAEADGDETALMEELDAFLEKLKGGEEAAQEPANEPAPEEDTPKRFYVTPLHVPDSTYYLIKVYFKQGTDMANIKAYTMVYSLKESVEELLFEPSDIMTNEESANKILSDGFVMIACTKLTPDEIMNTIDHVGGTGSIELDECSRKLFEAFAKDGMKALENAEAIEAEAAQELLKEQEAKEAETKEAKNKAAEGKEGLQTEKLVKTVAAAANEPAPTKQSFISVNVQRMDHLMDLIGELVIAEAVVLQNPDLKVPGLDLTNFQKAAGQLGKITTELQDVIMAMRMMPLGNTFQKMKRLVHDITRKLGKEVELKIIGEDTEVDKNIIEHISDPLMHLIRNAVDHGIEDADEREEAGKEPVGHLTLEAKNEGGKVWISVTDDGRGLSREKILAKAITNGLTDERTAKDLPDREVYAFITYPGFSTNEVVTEYSGRGVGMDVVVQNIQQIGGSLEIESNEGEGTRMTMKIPLTLAIIEGIILAVGEATFVVATGNVREFVKVTKDRLIIEPEGNESIMLRGDCYPVIRLKSYYGMKGGFDELEDGIFAIVEHEGKRAAVFVDRLIGEQDIVVKPIPPYIGKVRGLSGCTQLGDGSISLILDAGSLLKE